MPESRPNRQQILEIVNGFRPACVIGAAAELDLWTALGDQSLSAGQLAERLGCDPRAIAMLLDAVVALELLDKHDERYSVPSELRGWLAEDDPETVLPMLRLATGVLRGWSQLAWVVKAGIPTPRPSSIRGPLADRATFIAAMHTVSSLVADDLVQRLGPPKFRHLLDVGGASGTWTLAFLRAAPDTTATIFDLPDAIEQARRRLAGTEFAERVVLAAGDFYIDDLPGGADFAWISAICHQHSRRHNRELFAKTWKALAPGGRIAVRDVVMDPCRTRPRDGTLFAITMLVNTASGGTFTFQEYAEDLQAAGFEHLRLQVRHEAMNSVVVAMKPTPASV